jgi:uncharacterized protein
MTSPHTGSKTGELLRIDCPEFSLSVTPVKDNSPKQVINSSYPSKVTFTYCGTGTPVVTIRGVITATTAKKLTFGTAYECKTEALFFEQTPYQIKIRWSEKVGLPDLTFFSESPQLNKAIEKEEGLPLLSGYINFDNEVGFSDFQVRSGTKMLLDATIEVFPSKMDYKTDYQSIMSDITSEIYSLAFDFLKKTYRQYNIGNNHSASLVEFYALIRKFYQNFIRALDLIIRLPNHQLAPTHQVLPGYRYGHIDSQTISWLRSHPNNVEIKGGKYKVSRYLALQKPVTYDTRENRFTKAIIFRTLNHLKQFDQACSVLGKDASAPLLETKKMESGLKRRLNSPLFFQISSDPTPITFSMIFSMAPGYRELYKYYRLLSKGLSIQGMSFNLSLKDISQLYEYWCFIRLNKILREKYRLVSPDFIRVSQDGLVFTIDKGKSSRIVYKNPNKDGEVITLTYNQSFPREATKTIPQKPDNVLTLDKTIPGQSGEYSYVFDAKYKIDMALEGTLYHDAYQTPGPTEEDINTMHRYRDAIIGQSGPGMTMEERKMFGAYILFPYSNVKEYMNHPFYKSIKEVNIGGLPFLPNQTSMVEEMLTTLIEESPDSAYERAILPDNSEGRLIKNDWDNRDVLVGLLKSRAQLAIVLKDNSYWIPSRFLPSSDLPVHYIAIYQSKHIFGSESGIVYYGEVIKAYEIPRKFITASPKTSKELYFRFKVKRWDRLSSPIQVRILSPYISKNFHIMTTTFLLDHSTYYPELEIQNENEYRLMYELKNFFPKFEIKERMDKPYFEYNGYTISLEKDVIVIYGKKSKTISLKDFKKDPTKMVFEIEDFCK